MSGTLAAGEAEGEEVSDLLAGHYGTIYLITNQVNGKRYVGQTVQSLAARRRQYRYHAKTGNTAIDRALRKYGEQNFIFRELSRVALCDGMDLINKLEADAIAIWDTIVPNGYNLDAGGGNYRSRHPETKKKISDALKGHSVSRETREKLATASRGKRYCLGRSVSSEVRAKISQRLKGRDVRKEALEKAQRNNSIEG